MTERDNDAYLKLMDFMEKCGFGRIVALAYFNGIEEIATKCKDTNQVWFRPLEMEGSGFRQLFRGSIKKLAMQDGGGDIFFLREEVNE